MFWYVLVTNPWDSDLYPISIFLQRVPNDAKNEAKTRPENSFGTPPALAVVYHQPGSKSLAGVWKQSGSSSAAVCTLPVVISRSHLAAAQHQPNNSLAAGQHLL